MEEFIKEIDSFAKKAARVLGSEICFVSADTSSYSQPYYKIVYYPHNSLNSVHKSFVSFAKMSAWVDDQAKRRNLLFRKFSLGGVT